VSQRVLAVLSTASSVVLACLILTIAAGTGCGRAGLDDTFNLPDGGPPPTLDGDVSDTGPAGCNSATCTTGCCTAAGRCVSGNAPAACGTMGHECLDCQAGGFQYCDGTSRVCASNVGTCTPQNCPTGCCLGNACFSGTGSNACGSGGQACQPCASNGLACVNRQCAKPTCGPNNCAGCCIGDQCLLGTDQTACGQAGAQCTNCAANSGKCTPGSFAGGVCIASSCNASNCSGCCDGNGQCQGGFAQAACGAKGQSCFDCSRIKGSCIGQQCNPPPPPICGPFNCPGCCDSAGTCQVGVFDNQCGSRGASCFSCQQLGQKCLNQQCSKPPPVCNSQTCNFGCCDAQGLCQSGFGDATCGNFGNSCQNCFQFGERCLNQQCNIVPEGGVCNSQTCPFGCCDGFGNCQPGFSPFACGNFGNFCQNCGLFGEQCQRQQCTFVPDGGFCNARTCPSGCCDGFGNCQPGIAQVACGSFGTSCQNCAQFGQTCSNQQCVLPDAGFCDASNCKGCCDQFNKCQPGGLPAQCGTLGNFCQDCTLFGNQCSGGQCIPPCSQTCAGCCDSSGTCQGGFVDKQCGEQGTLCADCTALMPTSTCAVNLSPRTCASQQMSCPSAYAGCPASLQQPPTLPQKGACTSADLQSAAAACSVGAHATGCNSFFSFEQIQNPACNTCLQQFDFDFSEESGILACIAPVVDATCNHNSACINDCTSSACTGCVDPATTAMCQTAVRTGTCQSFYGNSCLSTALSGPGAVCDSSKYGNFGAWLQAVGAKYCQ
jgi:hypothetical protein